MIYIKRNYLIILSFTLIIFLLWTVYGVYDKTKQSSSNHITSRHTVVIDAGHGGKDAGTIGVDGTQEKAVNLAIAKKLYDYLSVSGIQCQLIRNDDYEYYPENSDRSRSDLYNRLDFVNSIDNAVLISIHQNHFEDEKEWGTQIWYSANTEESKLLADSILAATKLFLQPDNTRENKVSDSSYYLLYRASVPSVMVECGFMSNPKENQQLQNNQYQSDFAYCILLGACEEG